jgi:hypothetical protein
LAQSRPPITGTTHTLPFDRLSPDDFERLCLWLVEREGCERAEHLGASGGEQGRDIIAWREGQLWAFQCKRVRNFGPKDALAEVEKILNLPQNQHPAALVFLVTCDVSANTREQVRERCAGEMECHFWVGTELDMKVRQHPDILTDFFGIVTTLNVLRQTLPESEPAFAKLEGALQELVQRHDALEEWKELHHQLQTYSFSLRLFMAEVEVAYNDREPWNEGRALRSWSYCRVQLMELKSLAQRVKHIRMVEFREDARGDTTILRGDPWIVDIVCAGYDVEAALREVRNLVELRAGYDVEAALLEGRDLRELYDCTRRLFETCEAHLRSVDREIRQATANISKTLHGTIVGIAR